MFQWLVAFGNQEMISQKNCVCVSLNVLNKYISSAHMSTLLNNRGMTVHYLKESALRGVSGSTKRSCFCTGINAVNLQQVCYMQKSNQRCQTNLQQVFNFNLIFLKLLNGLFPQK